MSKITNLLLPPGYLFKSIQLFPTHENNPTMFLKSTNTELKGGRDLPKYTVPATFLFNLFALLLISHSSS